LGRNGPHRRSRELLGYASVLEVFRSEIGKRIVHLALHSDLEMQVRPGGTPGISDSGDLLAALDLLASGHQGPIQVRIGGIYP